MAQIKKFEHYRCWTRKNIEETVFPDLGRLAEEDTALVEAFAVRAPLIDQRIDGSSVAVDEVYQRFSKMCELDSSDWMFIKGRSGSGKTFVVRRLFSKFPKRDDYHLIYVSRGDVSLRVLASKIIDKLPGESAEKLRSDLRDVRLVDLEVEQHCRRIAIDLRTIMEAPSFLDRALTRFGSGDENGIKRREIKTILGQPGKEVGSGENSSLLIGLGALLTIEGGLLDHLIREDGALRRQSMYLQGSAVLEEEGLSEFVSEDLNCPEIFENLYDSDFEAHKPFRGLCSLLKSDNETGLKYRELAAKLMNFALPEALRQASGLSVSISEVFRDARVELAKEGKKIVLFFEDIALASGQSGAILDVLRDTSRGQAHVKALIAVTDGYEIDEAFLNLSAEQFEVPMLTKEVDQDFARQVFVRQMNLARIGKATAINSLAVSGDVPNACDLCAFQTECHATFGDEGGIGLYPLNHRSFSLALSKAQSDDYRRTGNNGFSPRSIVNMVHRKDGIIDRASDDILEKKHPSKEFKDLVLAASEPIITLWEQFMPEGTSEERANDGLTRVYRSRLLYSGTSSHSTVLEKCFDLPVVGVSDGVAYESVAKPPLTATPVQGELLWMPDEVVQLQNWIRTGEMPLATGDLIRKTLAKFVRTSIRCEDSFLTTGAFQSLITQVVTEVSFQITGMGRGHAVNDIFSRNYDPNSENTMMFLAVLWLNEFETWVQPAEKEGCKYNAIPSVSEQGRALLERHLKECSAEVLSIIEAKTRTGISLSVRERFKDQIILDPTSNTKSADQLLEICINSEKPLVPNFLVDDMRNLLSPVGGQSLFFHGWPLGATGNGKPHALHFELLLGTAVEVLNELKSSEEIEVINRAMGVQREVLRDTCSELDRLAQKFEGCLNSVIDQKNFEGELSRLLVICLQNFNSLLPATAQELDQARLQFQEIDTDRFTQLTEKIQSLDIANANLDQLWQVMVTYPEITAWSDNLSNLWKWLEQLRNKAVTELLDSPTLNPNPVLESLTDRIDLLNTDEGKTL
jgi:hypothetical protein